MQEIIKEIDAVMEENRKYRRDINEKLCEIRNKLGMMTGKDKKAEMTAKEAWDLAANISMTKDEVLLHMFGMTELMRIFTMFPPEEAKQIYDDYFWRNEKPEEETIKPGDKVDFVRKNGSKTFPNWIYVGEDNQYYIGILKNTTNAHYFDKGTFRIVQRKE